MMWRKALPLASLRDFHVSLDAFLCCTEKTKCFVAKLLSVRANKTFASTESLSLSAP